MSETIDTAALSAQMRAAYTPRFVCTSDTDLVVEGYPRSSNTFTVDYLSILAGRAGRPMRFAHHTHDVRNVLLGCALGVPTVVLIRAPVDAVSSFMIYSGLDKRAALARYVDFYAAVRDRKDQVLIAPFDQLTGDFNGFVRRLNARFALTLPLSADPAADAEQAKEAERARGREIYKGDQYAARVAVPNDTRREMARAVKDEVAALLVERPRANNLYRFLTA